MSNAEYPHALYPKKSTVKTQKAKKMSKNILIIYIIGCLYSISLAFNEETATYFSDSIITLKATIYSPEKDTIKPALILIHEGGFTGGSRFCFNQYGPYFAKRGYVVMSIDYRLVQQGGAYPEALKDCIEAVLWLKAHHEKYRIDKQRMAVIGSSAGAYLAVMVGVAGGLPDEIRQGHGRHPEEDARVRAVVSSFGLYDWTRTGWKGDGFIKPEQERAASPVTYAGRTQAAFLLLAGARDRLFDPGQAEEFRRRSSADGVSIEVCIKPRQDHAGLCDIHGPVAAWALPIIESFLLDRLKECEPCRRKYEKPEPH